MITPHPDDVTLNEYADGTLPASQQRVVDAHVSTCGSCRAVVDSVRQLRTAVRQLPPLSPPRHAWTRIERALRASGATRTSTRWQWLAVAAALAVAVLGGMKLSDLRRASSSPAPAQAVSGDAPTAQSIAAELQQAEQHYQNAIAGLERIANSERGSLDPQVASTLEKNLAVVDQAISESRTALKAQPSSEPAQASLIESFRAKIDLLQDTVGLINEMRRGARADVNALRTSPGLSQKDQ